MTPEFETPPNPKRFRAVTVPFDSDRLLGTRVREDPGEGKAALMHNFSGTGSTYVVPWRNLPLHARLAPFDAALHAGVDALPTCTPAAIRQAYRAVSERDVSNPYHSGQLRHTQEAEEDLRVELEMAIASRLLTPLGLRVQDFDDFIYGKERDHRIAALRDACVVHGVSPARFADIHGELVTELILVGLPGQPIRLSGSLRILNSEIAMLSQRLQRRLQTKAGNAEYLQRIAFSAARSAADAAMPLSAIDEMTRDLWFVLAGWPEVRPRVRALISDFDWCLDGWVPLLQAFGEASCLGGNGGSEILSKVAQAAEQLHAG
jgi:hypothetical protein